MKNTCPTKEILDYLLNPDKHAKTPEKLLQHALVCASCKRILNNPKIQKAFINALTCEETPGDKIRKAKKRSEITQIKPGQLWQIKVPGANEKIIAITTSELITESNIKAVRITPICTTHSMKDTDETDMFLKPAEMPLGLPCLVQWWNDRPILLKQLTICYGEISAKATKELLKKIKDFVYTNKLSPSGRLFRQIEINKGKIISAPLFEKIAQAENTQSNVFYINFSQFDAPDCGANEELAMAAASGELYLKGLEDHINNNKLPFACMRTAVKKAFLQLRSIHGTKFKLEITFKDTTVKTIVSDSRGIANIDLPTEEAAKIESVEIVSAK